MTIADDMFAKARSIDDIIHVTCLYIGGKIDRMPGWGGPINPETYPIAQKLIQINRLGVLTNCGQPARSVRGYFVKKTWKDPYDKVCGNWYIDFDQRSWLKCFVKNSLVKDLITFMTAHKVHITAQRCGTGEYICYMGGHVIMVRNRTYLIENKPPKKWQYRIRSIKRIGPPDTFNKFPHVKAMLDKAYTYVELACPHYGKGAVEDFLLGFLVSP